MAKDLKGKVIATGKLGKIAREAVANVTALIKKYAWKDMFLDPKKVKKVFRKAPASAQPLKSVSSLSPIPRFFIVLKFSSIIV